MIQMALTALHRSFCYWKGQIWSHSETIQKLSWSHQGPPGGVSFPTEQEDSFFFEFYFILFFYTAGSY